MSAVMRCPVCGARWGFPAMQTFTGRHQRMCAGLPAMSRPRSSGRPLRRTDKTKQYNSDKPRL